MTLQEAIKSGKPFKIKGVDIYLKVINDSVVYHDPDSCIDGMVTTLSASQLLGDWEIREEQC